jgi:3-oxoacyl-[acyl-carrier-protein] synthase-1
MPRRRVVITGLGIITAAGCGVGEVWAALRTGRTGLGPLTLFASPRNGRYLVGQVRVDVNQLAGGVRGSRSDKLAWIAAQEAIQQSGLTVPVGEATAERTGILLGSNVAGVMGTEDILDRMLRKQPHNFSLVRYHECASATDLCARRLGVRGPAATFFTSCSAGTMAIATAAELIANGEADVMLAGGADSLSRVTLNGFGSLLLLDQDGCRPFDVARAGISLGEGAAMLVLESEETATARGARILARLSGWGASCDATHATAPHPQGDGAVTAMRQALERGGLTPAEISFVSAHGTGTPDNDVMESLALRRVFGDAVPPFASVMRFFGHTLAASGAVKAVVCIKALLEQAVPPNPGFTNSDPKIGLEPVREFQARRLEHVLSNSFGFGGNNAVLVFSAAGAGHRPVAADVVRLQLHGHQSLLTAATGGQETPHVGTDNNASLRRRLQAPLANAPLAVVSAGLVSASGQTMTDVRNALATGGATPAWLKTTAPFPLGRMRGYACGDFGATDAIPTAKRRRLGHLQQMAFVAAQRSLAEGLPAALAPERVCAAIGTGFGCLGETAAFVENMLLNEERAPLAGRFSNSVHNACTSQLAIEFDLRGLNSTPTHREISFEVALWHCASELRQGRADLALAGAADELSPYQQAIGERWGWWNEHTPPVRPFSRELTGRQRPLPGEGATVFTLARADQTPTALAQLRCVRFGRFATLAGGQLDAQTEAAWIRDVLERDGVPLASVDLLLTGANGWTRLDDTYREVASALSALRGRELLCGAYKHASGEHHSASAFGFFVALGLVRGEIEPALCLAGPEAGAPGAARIPRTVLLYTLASGGNRAISCVCA